MICPKCGKPVDDKLNVCPSCGTPINVPQKKKSKAPLIIGIILGVCAILVILLVLIILIVVLGVAVLPGLLSDPKQTFAKNVVEITQDSCDEIRDIGSTPVEKLVHFGMDDTADSHTTENVTSIQTDALGTDSGYELVQTFNYDKSGGDTSYILSASANDEQIGSSGIYFNGNEFVYVPYNPMMQSVRYEINGSDASGLKDYSAIDRYVLMMMDMSSEEKVDWEKELDDFVENALADVEKEDFEKSKELYTVFGEEEECDVISVTLNGQEAVDLLEGLNKLFSKGMGNDETDLLGDVYYVDSSDLDHNQIIMTTYSLKKEPVAFRIEASDAYQSVYIDLSCYEDGNEKQTILDFKSSIGQSIYYEDSICSNGLGYYNVVTEVDTGDMFFRIDENGTISGEDRDLSGTFTYIPGNETQGVELKEDKITGSLSQNIKGGSGNYYTKVETEEGYIVLDTKVTRGSLNSDNLEPPTNEEFGTMDCGSDLEMLKSTLNFSDEDSDGGKNYTNNMTLGRIFKVFSLLANEQSYGDDSYDDYEDYEDYEEYEEYEDYEE
ncbi:MAG: zinc ribbon domain-containing protein [Lachnospiraceae bacterium]|nr:zinc ribbon domain-containing protein [Lachnospiraceae bacterium]